MQVSIGLDVGGTKIAGGVVDEAGTILDRVRVPTPTDVPGLVRGIGDVAEELLRRVGRPAGEVPVGVAAAGYIDATRSIVRFAPNIAWREYPLGPELTARLGVPVRIENDANAATWAEFRFGAGRDVEHMILFTIGTGVGGGLVESSKLVRGGFGMAAEFGHFRIVRGGRLCGCGLHGCLEMYASGRALVRSAKQLVIDDPVRGADLLKRAGGDAEALQGRMVTEAALAGDEASIALLAELGDWLGEGVAQMCAVFDPVMVVVGGGVAEAGELLIGPARRTYLENLTGAANRPHAEVVTARMGNDAGIIGAADLATIR
ncbi:ROK family glucokinase [Spongisporangium articulatum]|uniref:Glucokinase n=1 Tax=Spongisporangium articulatum TaxID=3362603 RepID=A0ABW8AUB5_9ACTN